MALHVLRDGTPFPTWPSVVAPPMGISKAQIQSWIQRLRGMSDDEFLEINRRTCERISGKPEPHDPRVEPEVHRQWASREKEEEIAELERYLHPRKIVAEAEHKEIWNSLWRAKRLSALKKACEVWAGLPDVRRDWRWGGYPKYVLDYGKKFFLKTKWRDPRFPKSDTVRLDESRIEYLARGMAGIQAGVSPTTGIERLRNMSHSTGGPLWRKEGGGREYCGCWRCGIKLSTPAHRWGVEAWWNGVALFMKLAGVKGPKRQDGGKR